MSELIGRFSPEVLEKISLPENWELKRLPSGKVRERYLMPGGNLLLITTDRISAFDVILGTVPNKGQVLNLLSAFWFEKTKEIFPNHLLAVPDSNVMIVRQTQPLPVEVVVRGYMTGVTATSIWGSYQRGERTIYGIYFRDGYKKGDKLDEPVITPTTKAISGHDQRLTEQEIIQRGIVDAEIWKKVRRAALEIFKFGQELAEARGFLLLDTKIEFGIDERGNPIIIDELLTPDSSRFALAATYKERLANGEEPDHFDKEYLRLAYAAAGYRGEGVPPEIPLKLKEELSRRYVELFEKITGQSFEYPSGSISQRIVTNLENHLRNN